MFFRATSFVGFKLFEAKSRWLSRGRGFGERRFGCTGSTASLTAAEPGEEDALRSSWTGGTAGPWVAEVV